MNKRLPFCIQIAAVLLMMAATATATTLEQLVEKGQLSINARLAPEADIVLYQPVTLEITVATDRWYARGTRVEDFEIEHAVVYRNSENSVNASSQEGGKSWAQQSWSISFYPQRAGALRLPPIDVFISVNAEGNEVVEGSLTVAPQSINVSVPAAMSAVEDWVATTRLSVSQNYDGLKESYQPGDAITRTISLQLENSPAMMLPALASPAIDGLSVYPVPPSLFDRSNRGQLSGHREQQFIYTIERAGHYTLPAYQLYWWNLDTGEQELIELDAYSFATEGVALAEDEAREIKADSSAGTGWQWLLASALCLLMAALVARVLLSKRVSMGLQQRKLRQQHEDAFLQALERADAVQAIQCLYTLLASDNRYWPASTLAGVFSTDKDCLAIVQQLQLAGFASPQQSVQAITVPGPAQGKQLLAFMNQRRSKTWPWQQIVKLQLNP